MQAPFPLIRDHVLLTQANEASAVDSEMAAMLSGDVLPDIIARIPDGLLEDDAYRADGDTPAAARARYVEYLTTRLTTPRAFAETASRMRAERLTDVPRQRTARR